MTPVPMDLEILLGVAGADDNGLQIGGKEWTAEKVFTATRGSKSWACGTVGWYQGSAFFLLTGMHFGLFIVLLCGGLYEIFRNSPLSVVARSLCAERPAE